MSTYRAQVRDTVRADLTVQTHTLPLAGRLASTAAARLDEASPELQHALYQACDLHQTAEAMDLVIAEVTMATNSTVKSRQQPTSRCLGWRAADSGRSESSPSRANIAAAYRVSISLIRSGAMPFSAQSPSAQ